jgi:hypothetical protein
MRRLALTAASGQRLLPQQRQDTEDNQDDGALSLHTILYTLLQCYLNECADKLTHQSPQGKRAKKKN